MKKTFLYFHGFNSDGIGYKPDALKVAFSNAEILSPDLDANPQDVERMVEQLLKDKTNLYFIGTSLGGFYAWYFSALLDRPCFLYNPSMRPHHTLDDRGVGHFKTWTKGRDYHFKAEYLTILADMKARADILVHERNLNFFLAKNDDVIDHSAIPVLYPNANHLQWFDNVGHRFSIFAETLLTVDEIINK